MYDKKRLFTGILFLLLAVAAIFGTVHNGVRSYYITIIIFGIVLGIGSIIHSKTKTAEYA